MVEPVDPNASTVVLGTQPGAASRHESPHNALPIGTRMGEFEIIGLVGEGGFGIVYLAQDHSLQRKVALKEYMPASLAARGEDASVMVRSERHQETFELGRRSFVNEARLLAQFDHPSLLKVYRFWEANGTAYMAMPYYDGRTLRDMLRNTPEPLDEARLKQLLSPVMDALEIIHAENCFHRDIAPDNIMLLRDERPVLLDFGAARRVISDVTQALTVILKPGYAPIEQYAEMPGMKQGAWTDIYALAAVMYFAITRKLPPPSVSRIVQDAYEPLATIAAGRYSARLLQGLDQCLSVKPEGRPQSIAAMREALGMQMTSTPVAPPAAVVKPAPNPRITPQPPRGNKPDPAAVSGNAGNRGVLIAAGLLALVLLLGGGYFFVARSPQAMDSQAIAPAPASSSQAVAPAPVPLPATVEKAPLPVPDAAATAAAAAQGASASISSQPGSRPPASARAASASSTRPAPSRAPDETQPSRTQGSDDAAEREYMRQLNRDLDRLLEQ